MFSKFKSVGLYIHVPFCIKKCPYCDFYSINYRNNDVLESKYFKSVIKEIESYKNESKKCRLIADTVYFGGGTPTVVKPEYIVKVLNVIKKIFKYKSPEVTIEANPNNIDEKELNLLNKAGVNRISFGMQSGNDDELYMLGRTHSVADVKNAIITAKRMGFNNISIDLMLSLPNQNIEKINRSLEVISTLDVQHVSAYMLKVEKNTMFNQISVLDKLPDEDKQAEIYLHVLNKLKDMGFYQYEISNFAKDGYESKHNLKYWNSEDYIGIGVSSHSCFFNKRYEIERNIYKYIGMADNNKFEYINNGLNRDFNEYVMLKLRTVKGIFIEEIKKIYPLIIVNQFLYNVKKFYDSRYIYMDDNNIKFTPDGFLIFNTILSNIMVD